MYHHQDKYERTGWYVEKTQPFMRNIRELKYLWICKSYNKTEIL
jgi:hypothetical protein